MFAPTLEENPDTPRVPQTQAYSLNSSGNLAYGLSRRVAIGTNLDLMGFTVGPGQTGTFTANSPVRSSLSGTMQEAHLTAFNALITNQRKWGSLNTDGCIRYRLTPRVRLRVGAVCLSTNTRLPARSLRQRPVSEQQLSGGAGVVVLSLSGSQRAIRYDMS